ncbi:ribosomal protein S18 acetylase RimI-like enzyme [Nocardioides luteus]|uniref:N-acetyltransferase n=1 Tax=Nocardioides luteus TaxID=1844 RepID=A0ABQ5T627_9ACTN|nr:GNAT family N-acetyltransferase [Nocardioides luteus]MDR7309656.1 ribosomal protein S18 acetylase RimI-like enzyme [Nocardioides luteus]GGR70545.1 N-acetyltransferase [Nocardioides luteus]GLJ70561.1 N-acetyltransferase [Nocardioides luteus]
MIELRAATPLDVPALMELWEVAAENDARPTDSGDKIETLIARDPDACTVAVTADGRIVGSLISGWDGWRAHLYRLAVHPDVRRQGLARRLLADAETRLVALGAGRIDAMVLEGNELGQSLWKSSGYRAQSEWRRWVRPVD